MQRSDNIEDNLSRDNIGARSAKNSVIYLLSIIFIILTQLYRLEFIIHPDSVHPHTTKGVIFLILAIQLFTAMICLELYFKNKFKLVRIISIIIALIGIASVFVIVFVPEMRALSN